MVEVSEIFFGNSFALNDKENLKAFVNKVKNVKGWYCGVRVHSFQPRLSPVKIATNQVN